MSWKMMSSRLVILWKFSLAAQHGVVIILGQGYHELYEQLLLREISRLSNTVQLRWLLTQCSFVTLHV
jgi:hypothetical protein